MLHRISSRQGKITTYLYILAVLVLSSVPEIPGSGGIPHFEQIGHFLEFFILVILTRTFLFKENRKGFLSFVISFAFLLEIYQYFIPWRAFQVFDLLVNFSGITLGVIFYKIVLNKSQQNYFRT
ncbi:MAG: VanZ family protein [Candidatus Aenigmatarchaeota archaeon]